MKKFMIVVSLILLVFFVTACKKKDPNISAAGNTASASWQTSCEDSSTISNDTNETRIDNIFNYTDSNASNDVSDESVNENSHKPTLDREETTPSDNTQSAPNDFEETEDPSSSVIQTEPTSDEIKEPCQHTFGEWTVKQEPTCGKDGVRTRVCVNCLDEEQSEAIEKTGLHTFINNKCQCGERQDSVGLAFTFFNQGCILTGIGECTDSCVVVPEYHKGYPVTTVAQGAFQNETSIEEIYLPKTIREIGKQAFYCNTVLKSVTIDANIASLARETFSGCTNLESVTLPLNTGLWRIDEYCFSGCTSLKNINLPEGITNIRDGAFYKCKSLTTISLPSSTRVICKYAFANCESLRIRYLGSLYYYYQIQTQRNWADNIASNYVQCDGCKVNIISNKVITD